MSQDNPGPTSPRKRNIIFNFESAIDKQIREAMERGDFDNLPGKGKPQDLSRDPNVPADWELAFRLLKNAGYAPDWIETLKQLRAEQDKLFAPFKRFLANPPRDQREHARLREKLVQDFRTQATELNRHIDTYNLQAPTAQVHQRRIRIDHEVENFLASTRRGQA